MVKYEVSILQLIKEENEYVKHYNRLIDDWKFTKEAEKEVSKGCSYGDIFEKKFEKLSKNMQVTADQISEIRKEILDTIKNREI